MIEEGEKLVREKGGRMIGWDEMVEGGVGGNGRVMWWRGEGGGIEGGGEEENVMMRGKR